MSKLSFALVVVVILEHLWFLVLESFLWTTPLGQSLMGTTPEQAAATVVLAQNQGLYNGFLAAGLVWGLRVAPDHQRATLTFFLGCVAVAGVVGAITAFPGIFLLQAVPALAALAALRWTTPGPSSP